MPVINQEDGTFVKEVAKLVHPEPKIQAAPRGQYIWTAGEKKEIIGTPLLAEPQTLSVATLQAIVDGYLKSSSFGSDGLNLVIQVVSPTEVKLLDPAVGDELQQFVYMSAATSCKPMALGSFFPLDEFIIGVLTSTRETDDRARLLEHVGGLTAGLATDISDNGASQETVSKRGITRAGAPVKWQNPVFLAPYRTFAEIAQPESAFILRLKQAKTGEEITAHAALFEGDGGQWKLEAITAIGAWLREKLPDATILA